MKFSTLEQLQQETITFLIDALVLNKVSIVLMAKDSCRLGNFGILEKCLMENNYAKMTNEVCRDLMRFLKVTLPVGDGHNLVVCVEK